MVPHAIGHNPRSERILLAGDPLRQLETPTLAGIDSAHVGNRQHRKKTPRNDGSRLFSLTATRISVSATFLASRTPRATLPLAGYRLIASICSSTLSMINRTLNR